MNNNSGQINIRITDELYAAMLKHPAWLGEEDSPGKWLKRLMEHELATAIFGDIHPLLFRAKLKIWYAENHTE